MCCGYIAVIYKYEYVHHPHLRSLHRSFLRQINQLPTNYLRQFFHIKVGDDLRTLSHLNVSNYGSKLKRVAKELRKMTAANNGDAKAFAHILDTAYGRKGRLRWELMEPLLSHPSAPLPDRIIPGVETSRPPLFSPELKALLCSPHSRTTKPLQPKALEHPPALPERANPNSTDAQLLGPFSKRREVNIRWRTFAAECKKVWPPLHVTVEEKSPSNETLNTSHHPASLAHAGIRGFGLQSTKVLEEIKAMAGPPYKPRVAARSVPSAESSPRRRITNRFIRRRYQELLGRIPILTYSHRKGATGDVMGLGYSVSLPPSAISPETRYSSARIPDADQTDMEWIQVAHQDLPSSKTKRNSNALKHRPDINAPIVPG